jgi:Protein kinase domain
LAEVDVTMHDEAVLRTVGRYTILREVGRGGTAIVYLARQTDLGRDVALKELAAFHAAKPAVVERFLRESRVTGGLNHPNVVTVHEYLEHEGTAYIAMEYFERGSLRPWVGSLALPQVAGVLDGLLAGLTHAESRGIVHRDLKPENVMVTADGGIKITDFGIAKALQASAGRSLTVSGTTVGTPEYMAPEQALGEGIGPWTDLYAVGVIAYELLAGEVPFPDEEIPLATLLRHVNEPVRPLRSVVPGVDPLLSDWVEGLLAKEPSARPGGAAEARDQLEEAVLGVLGPRWRREARILGGGALDGAAERPTPRIGARRAGGSSTIPTLERRPRRKLLGRRGAWLAAGLVLAGLATAIAVPMLRNDGGKSTARSTPARVLPDYLPKPTERVSLAVSGPHLIVSDPAGRIIQLARFSFRPRIVRDPAGPTSSALHRGELYVVDGDTLTVRRPGTLAPIRATGLPRGGILSGGASGPLVLAAPAANGGGRVCVVRADGPLGPCARTLFRPSGVGVVGSGGLIAVADSAGGHVVFFRAAGSGLEAAGPPVAVGRRPSGQLRSFRGRLYVAVERGIAMIDVAPPRRVDVIPLPVSPAGFWISRSGRLIAALPALDQLALLEAARPGARPLFQVVGDKPVAVTGVGETAYVAMHGAKRVAAIAARTGRRIHTVEVDALGAPRPERTVLDRVTARTRADRTVVTLTLAGSGLDRTSVVVRTARLAEGTATLELWQGGIGGASGVRTFGELAVRISRAPGHLTVQLSARVGSFTAVHVRRRSGTSIVLELPRPPQTPQAPQTHSPQPPASVPTVPAPTPPPPPSGQTTTTTPDCCVTG